MPVPLVPLKALAEAKGRLAPALGPLHRRLLAIAMFEDVIAALQSVPALQAPVVVSPDREVWRRADAMGCRVVEEPGLSLDVDTVEDLRLVAGRLDPAQVTARRLADLGMLQPLTGSTEEA